MAYIYQGIYNKWWLRYIIIYMASNGLYISRFIWEMMSYIYQGLYDKWWLVYIKVYMTSDSLYYQDLYDSWSLIYIKVYMTSEGLDISKFIWQVTAHIYQDLSDK